MEIWEVIDGFDNYSVSNFGRVVRSKPGRRSRECRELAQVLRPNGYLQVGLYGESGKQSWIGVHRLVASAFVRGMSDERIEVNHMDCNKQNNAASNLEWCSRRENIDHAAANGLALIGERNGRSVIDSSAVVLIRNLADIGQSHAAIASRVGISRSHVSKIVRRELWAHVPEDIFRVIRAVRKGE